MPTGTRFERHTSVAERGEYCQLGDGLPQNPR